MVDPSLYKKSSSSFISNSAVHQFKILILGELGVGKTALKVRYTEDTFEENPQSTTGIDFKVKELTINSVLVKLSIWDTAGSERYHSITRNYLNNAQGILLCFDITNRASFEELFNYWKALLCDFIEEKEKDNLPSKVYLIGTKLDLDNGLYNRQVTYDEADQLASRLQGEYYEVSAKTGEGVNEAFDNLAKELSDKTEVDESTTKQRRKFNINSTNREEVVHKSNCCSSKDN